MKLIEYKLVTDLSTWHGVCPGATPQSCGTIGAIKKVHVVFHDGGGGHRNAAVALQTVIGQQQRDWQIELIQFQDLTDRLDVLRKVAGISIQQQYNILLQNGWTLGSTYLLRVLQATIRVFHRPLVNLLERFWREKPADLLISVIPHSTGRFAKAGPRFIRAARLSPSSPTWPIFRRDSGSSQSKINMSSRVRQKPPIKRARWGMTTLTFF